MATFSCESAEPLCFGWRTLYNALCLEIFQGLCIYKRIGITIADVWYNERSSADSCVSQRVKGKMETKELSKQLIIYKQYL